MESNYWLRERKREFFMKFWSGSKLAIKLQLANLQSNDARNWFFELLQIVLQWMARFILWFTCHTTLLVDWPMIDNNNLKAPAYQCNTLITTSCIRTSLGEPLQQYSVVSVLFLQVLGHVSSTHLISYTFFSSFLHFWTSHNVVVVEGKK